MTDGELRAIGVVDADPGLTALLFLNWLDLAFASFV